MGITVGPKFKLSLPVRQWISYIYRWLFTTKWGHTSISQKWGTIP